LPLKPLKTRKISAFCPIFVKKWRCLICHVKIWQIIEIEYFFKKNKKGAIEAPF